MKLSNATLRPARVIEVLPGGQIKADAPGLFSIEDQSVLPPIYPWRPSGASGSFSSVGIGDEVWVMSQSDNPRSLHWMRKDELPTKLIDSEEVIDILCHREAGMGQASLIYKGSQGWILAIGEAQITISNDGVIGLDNGNMAITIDGGRILLGKGDHDVCYGDVASDAMNTLSNAFQQIMKAASKSVYTTPIAAAMPPFIAKFKKYADKISSGSVRTE